jgi:DNA-binding SARP family transcriptional activator
LYLFGKFRIEANLAGSSAHPQVESLLAYLILHPIPIREKLASFFWGDVSDAQARHSLRTALNTLRKHLGEQLILIDHETIQINPAFPVWVDASEFDKETKLLGEQVSERTITGLELYQGDLLADFYDDWILIERERYCQKYLDSLLQVTQELRSQSEYDKAIAFARTALAQDPANERAHQQLMFCYLASGDRTAALKQYEECRRLLQEELAVKPSPETIALYQWIKQAPPKAKRVLSPTSRFP